MSTLPSPTPPAPVPDLAGTAGGDPVAAVPGVVVAEPGAIAGAPGGSDSPGGAPGAVVGSTTAGGSMAGGDAAAGGVGDVLAAIRDRLLAWYAVHERDLPWREPGTTAWGVLVSEVMSQQTPVARVAPRWREWLTRWPGPAELAAAPVADVLRAWDRLGYPRRALRLRECAAAVVEAWGGELPRTEAELRTLPGVGDYTAAAVVAFAYGGRAVVLDTNVRRVLGRLLGGEALPPPTLTAAERRRAATVLPEEPGLSARWNVALMELGALVCTAGAPACDECPVRDWCAWRAAGYPRDEHAGRRRTQAWHGTDRQVRGRVMALLRGAGDDVVELSDIEAELAEIEPEQLARALAGLVADGLAARVGGDAGGRAVATGVPGEIGVPPVGYTLPA